MSRNEAPTPILRLFAHSLSDPMMIAEEVNLVGQDSLLVCAEFSVQTGSIKVIPWTRLTAPIPGPAYPGDPTDIEEEGVLWTQLTQVTEIYAEQVSPNPPPSANPGFFRSRTVEFDCQGFDAVMLEVVEVSPGTDVSIWMAAKRRMY